tara:strand:- start:184 stop:537 length:354 start_codon:yes stop_codon:yes gene_type:complete
MQIRYNILLVTMSVLLYGCGDGSDSNTESPVAPKTTMEAEEKLTDQAVDFSGDLINQAKEAVATAAADLKEEAIEVAKEKADEFVDEKKDELKDELKEKAQEKVEDLQEKMKEKLGL